MLCLGSQRYRVLFLFILFENTDFWKKFKNTQTHICLFGFLLIHNYTDIISCLLTVFFLIFIMSHCVWRRRISSCMLTVCGMSSPDIYRRRSHCVSRRRSSSCMFTVCGMSSPDIYRCPIVSHAGESVLAFLLCVACPPLIFIDAILCLLQENQFWHVYRVWHVLPWYLQMSHRVSRRRISSGMFTVCGNSSPDIYRCPIGSLGGESGDSISSHLSLYWCGSSRLSLDYKIKNLEMLIYKIWFIIEFFFVYIQID